MLNQCYYCEQIFSTKEDLYEHVSTHTDPDEKGSNKKEL